MPGSPCSALPACAPPVPAHWRPDDARAVAGDIGEMSDTAAMQARDVALLTLLYGCGLRIAEALALDLRDAPPAGTDAPLRVAGKGDKQRIVPVLPAVREAIAAWLPYHPTGSPTRRCSSVPAASGSTRRWRSAHCATSAACTACRSTRRRTRCATPSPRTCWRAAPICARSRNCWATPAYPPRSDILLSMRRSCWRCGGGRIRGEGPCPLPHLGGEGGTREAGG